MLEYYKTILKKVSFDRNLYNKEFQEAMENLNEEEKDELIKWIDDMKLEQKISKGEIFNMITFILEDMGYSVKRINEETNLEKDLDFDYLDLADFLIRIEKELKIRIDINLLPVIKYPQFESIGSTIDFLSKEYDII
ncbi:MAG: acyl carrier protein [Bacteroidales bacterium]|nr:acyl carrier protein [Bacteroidales bacterium]